MQQNAHWHHRHLHSCLERKHGATLLSAACHEASKYGNLVQCPRHATFTADAPYTTRGPR
eukprot:4691280-Alexandrium_andersonii.AAC.1